MRFYSLIFVTLCCSWRESNGFLAPTAVQTRSASFLSDKHNRLALSSTTISSNGELLPGIEAIDRSNPDLLRNLEEVRKVPYFRLYSVDMLGSCEYMPQELFECYSQTCEVYPVEDDKVRYEREEPKMITVLQCSNQTNDSIPAL